MQKLIGMKLEALKVSGKTKWLAGGLLAVLVLAGGYTLTTHDRRSAAGEARKSESETPVSLVRAQTEIWPVTLDASGAIAPWQDVQVASRIAGLPVTVLYVRVGDRVGRGQVIGRYDDRKVLAELQQAKAQAAQSTALAQQARINLERARGLKQIGAISEQDLLQAETAARTAIAQQEAAEASVAAAQLRLADTRITAPIGGIVSARSVAIGQVPAIGSELFRIIGDGRLEWRAELNASQMLQIRQGMAVALALPDGQPASGRVRQVAQSLDPVSRLGTVYVDLAPGSTAKAAMYSSGTISIGEAPAIILPAVAVIVRDGWAVVFRVRDGRAMKTVVRTARRKGDLVEIVDGLAQGESVVARGAGFLSDGERVRIVPDNVAAAKSAQP